MNENGGNTYFWSWATGALTALSLQDMIFALGAIFTAIFTVYTYRSNDRKNKALAAEARRQTEILEHLASIQQITPKEFIAATRNIKGGTDEQV
jgi:hypothetical protein